MRIGVIASMKAGLEHFVYRELKLLTAQGFSIDLFPTKYRRGLYNPEAEWRVHYWKALRVLLQQPFFFLRRPLLYVHLLWEAAQAKVLIDLLLAWHFSRAMQDSDAIYATFGDHKLFIGYFCKRILRKPLVVTIHAYELYRNPSPRMFPRALRACDHVMTVTEYNKEILIEQYNLEPEQVEVVRLSIDLNEYRPEEKFVVLIVGFFVERKGHEILFKAVKELAQEDIEVWIVGGEGTEEGSVDVRGFAKEIGIEKQVTFFGKLSDNALKALYRECDVFCLPCRTDRSGVREGFPTVLIEAMAFGKPVVTTRHVEIPRIIPEILVDENDVQGLTQALRQVYESAELRRRLGHQNRAIAEEKFSLRNVERTSAILRSLETKRREGASSMGYHAESSMEGAD